MDEPEDALAPSGDAASDEADELVGQSRDGVTAGARMYVNATSTETLSLVGHWRPTRPGSDDHSKYKRRGAGC